MLSPKEAARPEGSSSPFRRMIEAGAPDFWLLWYVGLVVATVRWVETVAVGIVVYQRTGVSGLNDHAPSASGGPVRVFFSARLPNALIADERSSSCF
jgi:hypothetical protein